VKFPKLVIKNFMAISSAILDLSDRGLVSIKGVNEDDTSANSNGAGKSSIPDAFYWCLTGTTARGESGDRIVNRVAKKDTMVWLDVVDDTHRYRIIRYRKHSKHKNNLQVYQDLTDITLGTEKLTQDLVYKILGSSEEVLKAAVYCGQDQMPDLPGMPDKQLKLIIEEAAGLTEIERAYEQARVIAKAREDHLTRMRLKIQTTEEQIRELDENISFNEHKADISNKQKEADIDSLEKQRSAVTKIIVQIYSDLSKIDIVGIRSKLVALDKTLADISEEKNKLNTLSVDVLNQQSNVNKAKVRFQTALNGLKEAKGKITEVEHKIGCPCDECGRLFTAEYIIPATEIAQKNLEAMTQIARARRDELRDAEESLKSVTETYSAFEATMTDVSATVAERASLLKEKDAFDELTYRVKKEEQIEINHRKMILDRGSRTNPYEEILNTLCKTRKDKEFTLKLLETEETVLKRAKDIADVAVKVFSPAGARARLLDEVTPFLNEQTAKSLGTLSDGNITATWTTLVPNAKGELKEQFSIQVTHAEGGESFKGISGGEKRKVRIACALAVQDLIARRATKSIDLFIGDEIDDALDDAGLERLAALLDERAQERGSVFIISHNDLDSFVRNSITVTKKDKISTITETVS
jgi:DNA repair exonuclease SbcCD ATPase subunit